MLRIPTSQKIYFRRNSKDARETSAAEVVDGRSNTGRSFLIRDAIGAGAAAEAIEHLSYGG